MIVIDLTYQPAAFNVAMDLPHFPRFRIGFYPLAWEAANLNDFSDECFSIGSVGTAQVQLQSVLPYQGHCADPFLRLLFLRKYIGGNLCIISVGDTDACGEACLLADFCQLSKFRVSVAGKRK